MKRDVCKKGCCWTPFSTCAKQRACACHQSDITRGIMAEAEEHGLSIDEVQRRRVLRYLTEGKDDKKGGGRWTRSR